ncbi:UTRA domain-containing protein [Thermocatellispora tengchongensis]|uniref:UTRA domain-containing protein n=1 Tax=Thermocatellispora tengchongensis TaxID=1073253 RepID=UPI00362ED91B
MILIGDKQRPDIAAPGNHPHIRAYGWDLGLQDSDTLKRTEHPPFGDERTTADRATAALLSVRPGTPVIRRHSHWTLENGSHIEINSWTKADLVAGWEDQKRYHQFRKRPAFFYQTLQREHGRMRWITVTSARIAYEDERAPLGLDYAEALLIIHRAMVDEQARTVEVTEVKAPANRFEIAHAAETGHDEQELYTPGQSAEEGVVLIV